MAGLHARLSASATKWWAGCPGGLAHTEAFPLEDVAGEPAQLGTCAHGLSERCFEKGHLPSDYQDRLIEIVNPGTDKEGVSILRDGAKWPKDQNRVIFEVDQDMVEATEHFVHYVHRRCIELGLMEAGDTHRDDAEACAKLVEKGTVRLEVRINPLPHRDDTGGSGDVIIDAWPEMIEIVDYKNGNGVYVPVLKNPQLRSYGMGSLMEMAKDWSRGSGTDLIDVLDYEYVRCTIVQPRHLEAPPDGVSSETLTMQEIIDWTYGWLDPACDRVDVARDFTDNLVSEGVDADGIMQALADHGHITVGEDGEHCYWCDLKSFCPAAIAKVQEVAQADFDFDEPDTIDVNIGANRLAMVLPWVKFVEKWAASVVTSGEKLVFQGGKIDGQKLVRKKSNRTWIKTIEVESEEVGGEATTLPVGEEELAAMIEDKFGLKRDTIFGPPKMMTGPQIEKLLPKEKRSEFSAALMFKPHVGYTIAPESDSRPEEVLDASGDFDDDLDEDFL